MLSFWDQAHDETPILATDIKHCFGGYIQKKTGGKGILIGKE